MADRIEVKRNARKALLALPQVDRARIGEAVETLANNPRQSGTRKLEGSDRLYRLRIAMPRKRFTVPFVEKLLPPTDKPQEAYFDTVLPAFGLRVGRKRKTYFVMVRTLKDGEWKMTRTNLGTTAELDLAAARKQAEEAMDRAAKGLAPAEVKVERKAAQADESRNTFSVVVGEFLRKYRGR